MTVVWSSDEPGPQEPMVDARLPRAVAVVTTLGAGILTIVGGAGGWARVGSGDQPFFLPLNGLEGASYGWEGSVVIVLGTLVVCVAALALLADVPQLVRGAPVVFGVGTLALVLRYVATYEDRLTEVFNQFDIGSVEVRIGYAAVVAITGAVFAIIGGTFAVLAHRSEPGHAGAAVETEGIDQERTVWREEPTPPS